ncbi:metallophosphoesterase [Streptomyces aurantiogriseus]|uniref:Membrane protein n=1 Tax=Streptomyces aurantiogriseus TaxID=66870 RepID=A0A918C033_9ACTN|nr:metallophosphoesterase [Streptomyces aurantiogriseus]GGR00861.1 membrane protein [Streptomyces aurantiogriseus]
MAILFVLLALSVLVTANWYLWRRLFRDTTRAPGWVRRGGAALIAGGWALAVGALVAERTGAPFWLQRTLAWPGFMWLALSIYLLLVVLAGELVRPLLRRYLERRRPTGVAVRRPEPMPSGAPDEETRSVPADRPGEETAAGAGGASEQTVSAGRAASEGTVSAAVAPEGSVAPGARSGGAGATGAGAEGAKGPEDADSGSSPLLVAAPSRRLFVSRVIAGTAAVAAAGTVGYGTYGVLRGPQVKRVTVPLAKLPRAAHGYRIAVVSDVHLGPVLGRGFAQKVVDTINGTQPDLIAVVGDLVDGSVKDLGPAAAPLAQLKARHGSFFVTGNHEYFSGAEQWVEEVRRLGLRPLENARTELPWFDLAGVNDVAGESEGQGPDFAKALGDRDTARACVLLAHQPVQIHDAVDHGVDLQLSGHTHGGQLWPGNLLAAAANPTVAGLERYGDTQLYVSRGAGAWGPPTRVGAPSDITVIELAAKQA